MKKILSILLCLLLCLSCFVGCTPEENTEPKPPVKISGKWQFTSDLNAYNPKSYGLFGSNKQENIEESITFTSNGKTFHSITWNSTWATKATPAGTWTDIYEHIHFDSKEVFATNTGTIPTAENEWAADAYRIVDFGAEPQTVSKDFYDWFTANATPVVS